MVNEVHVRGAKILYYMHAFFNPAWTLFIGSAGVSRLLLSIRCLHLRALFRGLGEPAGPQHFCIIQPFSKCAYFSRTAFVIVSGIHNTIQCIFYNSFPATLLPKIHPI